MYELHILSTEVGRVDTVQDVSIDIPINAVRFPRKSVKKTPPLERLKSRYNLEDNVRYLTREYPRNTGNTIDRICEKSLLTEEIRNNAESIVLNV
ncbi:hypothetical protein K0M31_010036, partial [Melipona bicolor]